MLQIPQAYFIAQPAVAPVVFACRAAKHGLMHRDLRHGEGCCCDAEVCVSSQDSRAKPLKLESDMSACMQAH